MSRVVVHRHRIVRQPRRSAVMLPPRGRLARESSLAVTMVLIATLPMFAQVFHYLVELGPLYYMSKAWPVIAMPLTLYAIVQLGLPAASVYLVVLAYLVGFAPMISIIQLGNGFLDAMSTTVKAWPFTYYFALSGMLALLAPAPTSIRSVCLGAGWVCVVLMVLIFLAAPESWYVSTHSDSKLLLYEVERGYRVYMPTFFIMLLVFYLMRSFMQRPNVAQAAAIVVIFAALVLIFKQRAAIGAAVLVTAYIGVVALPPRLRRFALGFVGIGGILAGLWVASKMGAFGGGVLDQVGESLGGSLTVRQNSFALATHFLGDNIARWAFGVGATTRFSTITLNDIFGNAQFFVADLGWVGVVFEYGLIGAFLVGALYLVSFVLSVGAGAGTGDPFAQALSDYILYLILSSAVYSLIFTPGELGTVLAIAIYLSRLRHGQTRHVAGTPPAPGPVPSTAAAIPGSSNA